MEEAHETSVAGRKIPRPRKGRLQAAGSVRCEMTEAGLWPENVDETAIIPSQISHFLDSLNSQLSIIFTLQPQLIVPTCTPPQSSRREHSGDVHPTLGFPNRSYSQNSTSKCRETGPATCRSTMAARPWMENSSSVRILPYFLTPQAVPINPRIGSHTRPNAHPSILCAPPAIRKTFVAQD